MKYIIEKVRACEVSRKRVLRKDYFVKVLFYIHGTPVCEFSEDISNAKIFNDKSQALKAMSKMDAGLKLKEIKED